MPFINVQICPVDWSLALISLLLWCHQGVFVWSKIPPGAARDPIQQCGLILSVKVRAICVHIMWSSHILDPRGPVLLPSTLYHHDRFMLRKIPNILPFYLKIFWKKKWTWNNIVIILKVCIIIKIMCSQWCWHLLALVYS